MSEKVFVCENLYCRIRTPFKPFVARQESGLMKHFRNNPSCMDHYSRTLAAMDEPAPKYEVCQPVKENDDGNGKPRVGSNPSLGMKYCVR